MYFLTVSTVTLFQSTLPRGERPKSNKEAERDAKFQSTLPRGERHGERGQCARKSCFNPRSRVGSDSMFL